MRTFGAVLITAAVVGLATGDRRFRLERAPLRSVWIFLLAALLQVVPFLPAVRDRSFAQALAPVGAVSGFTVLVAGLLLNIRTAGVVLMAAGAALNLAVIAANGGRMPTERSAADTAGLTAYVDGLDDAGPQRHVEAGPHTRLRILDDRVPVTPLRQVISPGDCLLALGTAWWLLAALGSRLVRGRSPEPIDASRSRMGEVRS